MEENIVTQWLINGLKESKTKNPNEKNIEQIHNEIFRNVKEKFNLSLHFQSMKRNLMNLKKMEGKYTIITNTNLDAKEILKHYRDRNLVELSFKKLFVNIKPIRHWKDKVLSHIFLAVIAFGLRSILELKLRKARINITAEEVISKLNQVKALCVKRKILKLTGETEETKKIIEALR